MASLTKGFADVQAGRLPDFPTIEWYFHTTNDPSVQVCDRTSFLSKASSDSVVGCIWVVGGWGLLSE